MECLFVGIPLLIFIGISPIIGLVIGFISNKQGNTKVVHFILWSFVIVLLLNMLFWILLIGTKCGPRTLNETISSSYIAFSLMFLLTFIGMYLGSFFKSVFMNKRKK